jgi:hypothetical protein
VALRLRSNAAACAVASADATIAVALVARIEVAYRAPSPGCGTEVGLEL